MPYRVILSRTAKRDLRETEEWLAERDLTTLRRWQLRFRVSVSQLSEDPTVFPEADEAAEFGVDLRMLAFGKRPHVYKVLSTISGSDVNIACVRHAARDSLSEDDL